MSLWRRSWLLCLACAGGLAGGLKAQNETLAQHEQRAQEYLRARQPVLARKELEAVVAADPGKLEAQANLGVLMYFGGDFQAAEPHLKMALALPAGTAKLQGPELERGV